MGNIVYIAISANTLKQLDPINNDIIASGILPTDLFLGKARLSPILTSEVNFANAHKMTLL